MRDVRLLLRSRKHRFRVHRFRDAAGALQAFLPVRCPRAAGVRRGHLCSAWDMSRNYSLVTSGIVFVQLRARFEFRVCVVFRFGRHGRLGGAVVCSQRYVIVESVL
ncbi:hypothetical protein D3C73_1435140 [compost metagenome]